MILLINYIKNRSDLFRILFVSIAFCLLLLAVRIIATGTILYAFLVWNLFLAIIPFFITTYLASQGHISRLKLALCFGIWLLFLPNAPYLITDLMHLRWDRDGILWLDVLVVTAFVWNGLTLCFLSLFDMQQMLLDKFSKRKTFLILVFVLFLCGFGIYLGRFLRWNSWDIVHYPDLLLKDIAVRFIYPLKHLKIWGVTLGFGAFLNLGFWMIKELPITANLPTANK